MSELEQLRSELDAANEALRNAYKMLAKSLDTSLMLSVKLTNMQERFLGRNQ